MITLSFKAWHRFRARRLPKVTTNWLRETQKNAVARFRAGILGPHSGAVARRQDGTIFNRSTPAQYPARDSGALLASLKGESTASEAKVGTGMFYSKFLREGTRFMARRQMSDTAMREAREDVGGPRGWVRFQRDK